MSDHTEAQTSGRWRRVPAVMWLPRYERGWLRGDVVAGAVVAALAVPQALGYASIAGAPVEVGLYAVPVALIAYAIFGSSRQLVVGPVSTVSVLSGSLLASFGVAGHGAGREVHGGAGTRLRPDPRHRGLPRSRLGGGVPLQADRDRLRPRPDRPGRPQRGAAPARRPTPKGQVVERISSLGESLTLGEADMATVIVSAVSLLVSSAASGWPRGC